MSIAADTIRVLLIEDEEAHAELIARGLEPVSSGVALMVTCSLRDASDKFTSFQPDIILADWRLPDGDALQLLKSPGLPDCPVVILTGHGDEVTAVEAMRAGALDYVVKSDRTFEEMPRIVQRALREWGHIVQRRRVEEALRESEAQFRSVIEHAQDIIALVGQDGSLQYVSPSLERVLGWSPRDVIRKNPLDWAHEDDRERVRTRIEKAFANPGTLQSFSFRARHRDGHWVILESVSSAYHSTSGDKRGVVNLRDITDRVQAEAERARLEDELRRTQRMEAIGQLAGGIAHDFNNLLTIISGHLELVETTRSDSPQWVESLREIKKAQESAASLTRQLLAFGGRQVMQPVVLNLNSVIHDVRGMLRRVLGEHVDLRLALADDLWRVKADPGQIEQIVVNILVNARDAMPDGGVIRVTTANAEVREDDDGSNIRQGAYVVMSFADTGCGMEPDVQERIFDPFFTTKERGRGTGLGLSTVYGIVKQSGGEIVVESEVGQGSKFSIYLPSVEEPERRAPDAGARAHAGGPETILLAEDEEPVRSLIKRVLIRRGYKVLEGRDGLDAMRVANEYQGEIDLLITDIIMPGQNGWQLAAQLHAARPDTKVLYISGYADAAASADRIFERSSRFLAKPFTPAVLGRTVREVLDSDDSSKGPPAD